MHDLKPKEKREARIISLQMIYAQEYKGSDIDTSLQYMLDPEFPPANTVLAYSKHLCLLTIKHMEEMDTLIKEKSKNWLPIVDAKILARKLAKKYNIKTREQWLEAYKDGKMPDSLPRYLHDIYNPKRGRK